MDFIYYLSGTLMFFVVVGLLILTIVLLLKPHLINKRKIIKTPLTRGRILAIGILSIVLALFSFGAVLAATEPEAVKQQRLQQEAAQKATNDAEAAAKQAAEEASKPQIKTETEVEVVPFGSTTNETSSLNKGEVRTVTSGVNGEKTVTYSVTYVNGKQTNKDVLKTEVTKEPVSEVKEIGTYVAPVSEDPQQQSSGSSSDCNPNYSGCVPNVSYDLNCKDIGYKVKVIGYDQYNLDGDNDGYGCDSY